MQLLQFLLMVHLQEARECPNRGLPQNALAPPETPYTPFVPNESRNPPTAAYSGQEVPHRKMQLAGG